MLGCWAKLFGSNQYDQPLYVALVGKCGLDQLVCVIILGGLCGLNLKSQPCTTLWVEK